MDCVLEIAVRVFVSYAKNAGRNFSSKRTGSLESADSNTGFSAKITFCEVNRRRQ